MLRLLGFLAGMFLAVGVQSSQALAAPWAPAVEAALPANAASHPHVSLASVSCASAGNCSAVGIYHDRSVRQQVLLLIEAGGAWEQGVEATLPANAAEVPAYYYNCPSAAGNCSVYLTSVSCASAGNCSAVGVYNDSSGHQHGLLVNETAGRWAPGTEAILPANAAPAPRVNPLGPVPPDVVLGPVSCASAGDCSAVGDYWTSSGHQQGLLLSETSGEWTQGVEAALPADASSDPDVALASVSCGSAGECSAVGTYDDSSNTPDGLLLNETDGTWASGIEATPPPNASAAYPAVSLSSVACASAGSCTAVGSYGTSAGDQAFWLSEAGGKWAAGVETALPANAAPNPAATLQAVSCASTGNCGAVGTYEDSAHNDQGLLLDESGGTARAVAATLPANAGPPPVLGDQAVELGSVSCGSVGNCTALGNYWDSAHRNQPLLLSETSGTWTAGVEATPPANAKPPPASGSPGVAIEVDSVSCAPGGDCSAVGSYGDKSGHLQGMLLGTQAVLSRLRVAPKPFSLSGRLVGGRCVKPTATNAVQPPCKRPLRLKVSYRLNIPAQVTITVERAAAGRLSKRRCVAPSAKNRTHGRCTRLVTVRGTLTENGHHGSDSFTFNGRVDGAALARGTYRLTATPSFGNARTVGFRITG